MKLWLNNPTDRIRFSLPNYKMYVPLSFSEYDQPHESQTNKDIVETISRKGLGGFGPDSPEGDADYAINEESSPGREDSGGGGGHEADFQQLLHSRNAINAANSAAAAAAAGEKCIHVMT